MSRLKLALLLGVLCLSGFAAQKLGAAILPDTLTVTNLDITGDGTNDVIVLYKRSIRAANYRLWTWTTNGGYVRITNVPPVCTYRGHVQSDPSLRINGFVNYLGKLSLNVNQGQNNTVARPENVAVDLSGPPGTADPGTGNVEIPLTTNRVSPTAQGFLIPRTHMRKMRVGIDTTAYYCANPRYVGTNGTIDIGLAVAAAEQRLNDTDYFYARDMGLAWEVTDFVLRLNGDPANWKTFWAGGDAVTPQPFNEKIRLDGDTGGGSAGMIFSATLDFPNAHSVTTGGPNKWESASIGHETAHGLTLGHYSSHDDTMSGAESALGAGSVQRAIEQMQQASAVSAPAVIYGDVVAPYAMEDYANTLQGQPVDIDVLANDYDGNGDVLHVSYVDAVTEAGGTVTNLGGGVVRYQPPARHLGVDRFRYYVADSGGVENRTGVVKVYSRNTTLAHHWLFDETGGSVIHDVGPCQTHGQVESGLTSINAGAKPGKIGNAYQNFVQGSLSSVAFDTGDPLDGDLSVSLWVRFDSLTNNADICIASKGGAVIGGRTDTIRGGWSIVLTAARNFYFACKLEPDLAFTNVMATLRGTGVATTNQWYHLAMVMDRTNHVLKAWINGVQTTSSPSGNTFIPNGFIENYHPLHLLNCSHDNYSASALVDDVRIYNKVLSGAEVAALYTANDEIPAGAPSPKDGAQSVSALTDVSWMPGKPTGYTFDLYLGTNQAAVLNADTNSAEYLGRFSTNSTRPNLNISTTYYWRVDETTTNGTMVPGRVWTFTTKSTMEYVFDNGAGDGIWTNALNWNPDGVPTSDHDYVVTGNYTAISPGALEDITPTTYTFGGRSLTVTDGATLNLKKLNSSGTDTVTINITNLTINNATLMSESGRNYDLSLNTSVKLTGDNAMNLGDGSYQRWLRFKGGMSGSGSLHLSRSSSGSTRQVYLASGNFGGYAGNWLVEAAASGGQLMELICQTTNGWGNGSMTLGANASLTISTNVVAPGATLNVAPNATAELNGNLRIGGLSGSGGVITNNSGAIFSVGLNNADTSYAGIITGGGSLVKEGAGTLTLTGANSYSGSTIVTNTASDDSLGALRVDGSLSDGGPVTVHSGCSLGGSGTIGGVVTVKPGAFLAPGNESIATLTVGSAPVLQGTLVLRLNRAGSQTADKLVRTGGSLAFGGSLVVTNVGPALSANDTFTLFNASAYTGSFSTLDLEPPGVGLYWNTNALVVNGTISVGISTYTLTYAAGANGTLTGLTPQTVNYGSSGTAVTAVANAGYAFTNWTDGVTANPRTDTHVTNNLSVTANFVPVSTGALPPPWGTNRIGTITATPAATYTNGVFTVTGAGANISGKSDNFWYVNQAFTNDATLVAHVVSLPNTGAAARAGVMMREGTNTGARMVLMSLSSTNGAQWVRRSSTGGNSSSTTVGSKSAPHWMRLDRTGNSFNGYISDDGTNWSLVASVNLNLNAIYLLGLAVCSGASDTVNVSLFDNLTVNNAGGPSNSPPNTSTNSPVPAILGPVTHAGQALNFKITGTAGSIWQLEESSDLTNWTILQKIGVVDGAGEQSEADGTQSPRFLRLHWTP